MENRLRSILVVEDNESLRLLTCRMLQRLGYAAVGAARPNEALLRFNLAEAPVDLLLTDVALPDLGGRELARRMKRAAGGLRVVFMSGHDEQGLREDGRLDKSAPFLQKPFDRTTLAKTVQGVFDAQ